MPKNRDGPHERGAWRRRFAILTGVILVLLAMVVAPVLYVASNFSSHLDRFSEAVERGDAIRTRQERLELESFYALSKKWKLEWVGRRFLFNDARLYDGAYQYLIGDYKETRSMIDGSEDYRAYHLRGNTKFREAEDAFLKGAKKESAMSLLAEAQSYYKQAVKRGPGPDSNFDDTWNYDLVSALMNGELSMRQVFAPPKKGAGPLKLDSGDGSGGKKSEPNDRLNQKGSESPEGKRRG